MDRVFILMLKKSDLAKQFELVVKQEIKNHNDAVLASNLAINELRDQIKKMKADQDSVNAVFESKISSLISNLLEVTQTIRCLTQSMYSDISEQKALNNRSQSQLIDVKDTLLRKINIDNNFQEKIEALWKEVHSIRQKSDTNYRVLNDNIDDLMRRFTNDISRTKKEILEAPTEAKLVRTQLEEKIACHKVDVAGIMRELNIYKSDNMITQKKIENIYTLIERLKKSEVIH